MKIEIRFILLLTMLLAGLSVAQTIPNSRLSAQDLDTARIVCREVGGGEAELTYAIRLDLLRKASFDSLLIVYAKPSPSGGEQKDYFAFVFNEGKKYLLSLDQKGRALPAGDQFLRTGLRRTASGETTLRIVGAIPGSRGDEKLRNVDYQFNGSDYVVTSQSIAIVPK